MSLLVLDIGNSAIKGGLVSSRDVLSPFRIPHHGLGPDDVRAELTRALTVMPADEMGIASVVPHLTDVAMSVGLEMQGAHPFSLNAACRLPISLGYAEPERIGPDRIAASVAGYYQMLEAGAGACVVIDAGSAVTLNVVTTDATFRGGMIWAGPDLVLRALSGGTAQLPLVSLDGPMSAVAGDTVLAIRSAALWGFLDGVAGLLERVAREVHGAPLVIATGGRGELLRDHLDAVDEFDPHLVLRGVRRVWELNRSSGQP